ncbi:hypothetical protein SDC9_175341 [bioreactor metagenome]|uniref:Uncharacterized protein n=1 Tax=bioreactor metagenome TaxID=1076179 RepID=A0A645GLZ1_9ZZZZ
MDGGAAHLVAHTLCSVLRLWRRKDRKRAGTDNERETCIRPRLPRKQRRWRRREPGKGKGQAAASKRKAGGTRITKSPGEKKERDTDKRDLRDPGKEQRDRRTGGVSYRRPG